MRFVQHAKFVARLRGVPFDLKGVLATCDPFARDFGGLIRLDFGKFTLGDEPFTIGRILVLLLDLPHEF
jgi:hypothetical protein